MQMVSAYEPQNLAVELVWDEDLYVPVGLDHVTDDIRVHTAPLGQTSLIKDRGRQHGQRPSKVVPEYVSAGTHRYAT